LRTGRSGSLVLALRVGEERLVLKVTERPDRLVRAELEAALLGRDLLRGLAPELVASAVGPGWVAIATRECTPLGSGQHLDRAGWSSIAARLAVLHREPAGVGALLPRRQAPSPEGDDGRQVWQTLGAGNDVERGEQRLDGGGASGLPLVLEHGDCHLENVVRTADGRLVWVDWQECGLGDGIGDLVFLWQRAEFAGARPPRPQMTAIYAEGRGLDPTRLQPALDLVELRLLLYSWPPFLGYGTEAARDVMRSRLAALVDERPRPR
jgi:hypothetical protein